VLQEKIISLEYDVSQYRTGRATSDSGVLATSSVTASPSPSVESVPAAVYDELAHQHNVLLAKIAVYQRKLADWETWKLQAESITQDLAKRLKEEQKIRRKLDALLAHEAHYHQQRNQQQLQGTNQYNSSSSSPGIAAIIATNNQQQQQQFNNNTNTNNNNNNSNNSQYNNQHNRSAAQTAPPTQSSHSYHHQRQLSAPAAYQSNNTGKDAALHSSADACLETTTTQEAPFSISVHHL